MTAEEKRLDQCRERKAHWKRWGPFVSERAWGTVREDYSQNGAAWEFLGHDHARSKAYRWNEDGLAGICDRHQKICFVIALWNGRDPILKERLLKYLYKLRAFPRRRRFGFGRQSLDPLDRSGCQTVAAERRRETHRVFAPRQHQRAGINPVLELAGR